MRHRRKAETFDALKGRGSKLNNMVYNMIYSAKTLTSCRTVKRIMVQQRSISTDFFICELSGTENKKRVQKRDRKERGRKKKKEEY